MPTGIAKTCVGCGTEVSQQKRVKDQEGRYYCHPCWADQASSLHPKSSVASIATEPQPVEEAPWQFSTPANEQPEWQPAPVLPARNQASHGKDKTDAESEGMSKVEKCILFGGIAVGLIVVVGLVYFLFMRTWWEDHNQTQLLALKDDADTLARSGKLIEAKVKYEDLFGLVGGRQIHDQSLQDDLSAASTSLKHVSSELADEEQAKRNADITAAAKAKAEQDAAAERAKAEQQQLNEDRRKSEAEELAKKDAEQQRLQAHLKDIADTWLNLAKAESESDDLGQLEDSQKGLLQAEISAGDVQKSREAADDVEKTIRQKSACDAQSLLLLQKIQTFDSKESGQVAARLLYDPNTPRRYLSYIQHYLQ